MHDVQATSEPIPPEVTSNYPYRTGGEYDELLMNDAAEIMRENMRGGGAPQGRGVLTLPSITSTRA